jgi:hypothetical protein
MVLVDLVFKVHSGFIAERVAARVAKRERWIKPRFKVLQKLSMAFIAWVRLLLRGWMRLWQRYARRRCGCSRLDIIFSRLRLRHLCLQLSCSHFHSRFEHFISRHGQLKCLSHFLIEGVRGHEQALSGRL